MKRQSLRAVKDYWDANPVRGNFESFEQEAAYLRENEAWLPLVLNSGRIAGKKVLIVGCGQGYECWHLNQLGARVTGLDLSGKSLDRAFYRLGKENVTGVMLVQGNAEHMPFRDAEFDAVYSLGVLHHTPNIQRAVSECRRVLKPGGRLVLMLYRSDSLQFKTIRLLKRLNSGNWLGVKNSRTFWTELFTCPIANSFTGLEVVRLLKGFRSIELSRTHTGLTRLVDWQGVERFLAPEFGCYLVAEAVK